MTSPKLNDTLNLGQFILAVVTSLVVVISAFFHLEGRVHNSEVQIQQIYKEIDKSIRPEISKFETKQEADLKELNQKMDRVIEILGEVRVDLEKKEDRKR